MSEPNPLPPVTDPEFSGATLLDALRVRYCDAEGYAVLSEVRDVTGYSHGGRRRYADLIAMGTWASRGFLIEGFEVKIARSDWLRELDQPEKAEPIFRFCNQWWLVSSPDVAQLDEIPVTWGWMEFDPQKRKLKLRKQAPVREHPDELSRPFLASLLRSLARQVGAESRIAEETKRARSEGFAEGRQVERELTLSHAASGVKSATIDAADARLLIEAKKFEKQTGMRLDGFELPKRVKAALALMDAVGPEWDGAIERLVRTAKTVANAATELRKMGRIEEANR